MALKSLVIKNDSGSDQLVRDLGVLISNGGSETYTELDDIRAALLSENLRALATAGTLVLNDGTSDVPADEIDSFIQHHDTGFVVLDGTGTPTGVTGFYGQPYKDLSTGGHWYRCSAKPFGVAWDLEEGPTGPSGETGDQGYTGPTGATGPTGSMLEHEESTTTTNNTVTTIATVAIPDDTLVMIGAKHLAVEQGGGGYAAYWLIIGAYRISGGSVILLNPPDTLYQRAAGSGNTWSVGFTASGNNVLITVKGSTGDTVDWKVWYTDDKNIEIQ